MVKGALLLLLVVYGHCFYAYLTPGSPQCFYNAIYKDQRLLVEVETPIISLLHKIVMKVTNGNTTLLEQDIVNQAKFTVPRPSNIITDKATNDSMEYQTCFSVVTDPTAPHNDNENPVVAKSGYLVLVKMFSNFEHKIEANKMKGESSTEVNYRELTRVAKRLKEINSEQVSLHQINEVKEKLSQFYLQTLKGKIIVYSILEIVLVVLFTMLQVRMLKGYLNNISVI